MHRLIAGGPVGLMLAVAFAGWTLLAHPDAPRGTPVAGAVLADPLGYANANAALQVAQSSAGSGSGFSCC